MMNDAVLLKDILAQGTINCSPPGVFDRRTLPRVCPPSLKNMEKCVYLHTIVFLMKKVGGG